jgi:hypothetical protein
MIRVRGRAYDSEQELQEAIDEMEQLADDEIDELRSNGAHAEADRRADVWKREIDAHRAALRTAKEKAAKSTSQPKDKPTGAPRRGKGKPGGRRSARKGSSRASRGRRRRGGSWTSGWSGRLLRGTGATGAAKSVTTVALEVFGLLIALALLIVLLDRAAPSGGPVPGLIGLVGEGLNRIVAPVDPFTGAGAGGGATGSPPPARAPRAGKRLN